MRPSTVHYVVSTDDAIVLGRHFYAASTIRRTISGMVHTFITGFLITNDSHERTNTLIRRLFALWLRYYVADEPNQNNGESLPLQQVQQLTVFRPQMPCSRSH